MDKKKIEFVRETEISKNFKSHDFVLNIFWNQFKKNLNIRMLKNKTQKIVEKIQLSTALCSLTENIGHTSQAHNFAGIKILLFPFDISIFIDLFLNNFIIFQ